VVDDARVRHLLSIPGFGLQTAVGLVALIGDVGRFPRPNKLVGYLGLDPIVRQSGDRPAYTGHISHGGQGHVRGLYSCVSTFSKRTARSRSSRTIQRSLLSRPVNNNQHN
jgi:transposase